SSKRFSATLPESETATAAAMTSGRMLTNRSCHTIVRSGPWVIRNVSFTVAVPSDCPARRSFRRNDLRTYLASDLEAGLLQDLLAVRAVDEVDERLHARLQRARVLVVEEVERPADLVGAVQD